MKRTKQFNADYVWRIILKQPHSSNPDWHEERLNEPNLKTTPQLILVAPAFDICHTYVSTEKFMKIWNVMTESAPWHQYIIRTRYIERLLELKDSLTWTPNLWIGVPLESILDIERLDILKTLPAIVKFVIFLPPRKDLFCFDFSGLDWIVAGGGEDQRLKQWYHYDWLEALHKKSQEQKVPFYFTEAGKYAEINRDRTYHFSEVRQLPFKSEWIDYYRQLDKPLTISDGESWGWREPFPETMKIIRQRQQRSRTPRPQPVISEIVEESNSIEQQPLPLELQRNTLKELEQIIHTRSTGYFAMGEALTKIQDEQLYRVDGFRSFSKYCKERFRMSRIHGYRLIAQYHMNHFFVTHGLQILPERQTRLLRGIPLEEALILVKKAQNATVEGFLSFNDSLESVVKEYRQNHVQQSSNDITPDGTFFCQTLNRRIQYREDIPAMIAELSKGDLGIAAQLIAEFSSIEYFGELDKVAIAQAVINKDIAIKLREFSRALGFSSISVQIDEIGF